MSYSDIEHYATMINGYEAISQRDFTTPDAIYASAVLNVYGTDLSTVSGQEGFLDSIKKGASNVVEWVKKIAKAIKDWILNIFKKKIPKGAFENNDINSYGNNLIKVIERTLTSLDSINGDVIDKSINKETIIEKFNSLHKKLTTNGSGVGKAADDLTTYLNELTNKIERLVSSLKKEDDGDQRSAKQYGNLLKIISDYLNSCLNMFKKFGSDLTPSIAKEINNGSVNHVRAALMAELESNNIEIDTVKRDAKKCKEEMPEIFVEYKEDVFSDKITNDKTEWTEDLYFKASAALTMNFSEKRFNQLLNIYEKLRQDKVKGFIYLPKK